MRRIQRIQEGMQVLIWDVGMLDLGYDSPVLATILFVNGDQVDVVDPDGAIDCFPTEWCWAQVEETVELSDEEDKEIRAAIEQADMDMPATAIDVTCVVKIPKRLEGAFAKKLRKTVEEYKGHLLEFTTPDEVALTTELSELRAKIESYDGGDRPPSPPARLLFREDEIRKALRDIHERRR